MRIQEIQQGLLLAALLLCSLVLSVRSDTFMATAPRVAFAPRQQAVAARQPWTLQTLRGGATLVADDEEEDLDEEEEEEEASEDELVDSDDEEEEEDEFDASLAAAAVKSTQKTKSKTQSTKTSTVKQTMSAKLVQPKKKKKGSLFKAVPYILRACLNPFTVMSMTKHFWVSLFNLEYPPKVS